MSDNINIDELKEEILLIKNNSSPWEKWKPKLKKENLKYKLITVQKEFLRIKYMGIIFSLFLKLLYKILFLVILYVSFQVPIIKHFLLNIYFAHFLFFFMFILLTIDIIFLFTKFMSDVQEVLTENIYIETVTSTFQESPSL